MNKILCFVFCFAVFSCKNEVKNTAKTTPKQIVAQDTKKVALEVYDFKGLKPFLERYDDTVYVVNFWATWCSPCVKELPAFEKLRAKYLNKNVKVLLVSLDFPDAYNTKLKPFIIAHNLKAKVVALDDVDANTWIPLVNKDWTGSLPATLIYKNRRSKFFEQSFTYQALEQELKPFLN